MRLEDLTRLVARTDPDLATAPWSSVDLTGLSRPLRRQLTRLGDRGRIRTVADAIGASEVADAVDQWRRWLGREGNGDLLAALDSGEEPVDDPAAGLTYKMSATALRAWARARDVENLIDTPVSALTWADNDLKNWFAVGWVRENYTLGELCTGERHSWHDKPQAYARRAAVDTLAWATRTQIIGQRWCDTRATAWATPPADEVLRELWEELHARAAVLRAEPGRIPMILTAPLQLVADDANDQAIAVTEAQPITLNVPVHVVLRPWAVHAPPWFELCAVHGLLDALATPGSAREVLADVLSRPAWERDLKWLDAIVDARQADADRPLLGWRVRGTPTSHDDLVPVLCSMSARGTLKTRQTKPTQIPPALLHGADLQATESLRRGRVQDAMLALVGHPRVLIAGRTNAAVPVRRRDITLHLESVGRGKRARLDLIARVGPDAVPTKVGAAMATAAHEVFVHTVVDDDVITVYVADTRQTTLWRAWQRRKPQFTADALPGLRERLPQLASTVDLHVDSALRGDVVPGDDRPVVLLAHTADGLTLDVRMRPLPEAPAHPPGSGPAELYATRDGKAVVCVRDLAAEPQRVAAALAPLGLPLDLGSGPATIASVQQALAVVESLQARPNEVRVEWDGAPLYVAGRLHPRDLRARVQSSGGMLRLLGGVDVQDDRLDVAALLEAALSGHAYAQLSRGGWVRLEESLRAALEPVAAVAAADREGPSLSELHSGLLDDLRDAGAELEVPTFSPVTERIAQAAALEIEVPDGLRAELRAYQRVGFTWLARLSHWAPGAILADDMGLGKTVQAIALLLRRAELGPALVVAPTSVVFNWERELARFAPSLEVVVLHGAGREHAAWGPGHVVLTTYGTLLRDAEALAACAFGTAVLDEGQAIKNPASQRARAAFRLDAAFRVVLSGTPVENRTEELWSLLRFAVPGLLAGAQRFRDRFAAPIAAGDAQRRSALARVVSPFLLRRRKAEVEPDLPARTEQTVHVVLSADERALYERNRLAALARVETAGQGARMQVLKELTRLRQLACHPRLVDPGSPIPSSKLRALRRLVADLREGGHQALVFSQFTRHLDLAREALQEDGVRLLDIRGGTRIATRAKVVDAFQRGEAEVLTISLKAGGTGLNLTAATFVIHLDPWWNPASEDQATDRAHRIGQQRPVTVYRLVSRGTIEEQVVALHATKRDLAEALLTRGGGATSVEQLVSLLREAAGHEPLEDELAPEPEAEAQAEAPPTPEPTPPVGADAVLAAAQASWDARVEAEMKAGKLKASSAKAYSGVITRMLAAAAVEAPPSTADDVRAFAELYRSESKARARTGSDRVFAGGAIGRFLEALADDRGASTVGSGQ